LLKRANVGVEHANRFASLVVLAAAMALAVIIWSYVAGGVREGLLRSMVAIEAGSSLFGSRWPVSLFLLCTNIWIGIGAVAAASILCGRPIGRRTIIAAAVIAAICGFVAMFLIAPHRWEWPLDDLLKQLSSSRWVSLSALKALVGGVVLWGGYGIAMSMCLAAMGGNPRVPMWSLALPAWFGAAIVALGTPLDPATGLTYVGPALLMASISRLFGRSDRKAYLVVMMAIGLLAGWFTGLLEPRVKWLTPILAFAMLFPAQLAFTRPKSVGGWIGDLLFASLAVVLAKYLQFPLLRIDRIVAITPGAILVAVTLAASVVAEQLSRRNEMVRHLRLFDRYASRSWSIRPLSDPT
jgi:hypothetical protein